MAQPAVERLIALRKSATRNESSVLSPYICALVSLRREPPAQSPTPIPPTMPPTPITLRTIPRATSSPPVRARIIGE